MTGLATKDLRVAALAVFVAWVFPAAAQDQMVQDGPESYTGDSRQPADIHDSLQLRLIDAELSAAAAEVSRNSFWRRFFPKVTLSASFGVRDLLSADPASGQTYFLPQDSYRLFLSLSLTDLFDNSRREAAELKTLKLLIERDAVMARLRLQAAEDSLRRETLRRDVALLSEELKLVCRLVEFYETRFEQGAADFSTVIRARLQLIGAERSLRRARGGGADKTK